MFQEKTYNQKMDKTFDVFIKELTFPVNKFQFKIFYGKKINTQ